MAQTYREYIIQTINTLVQCDIQIFTEGLNVLMSNELEEINQVFEVGDTYDFTLEHLESAEDTNVQLIVKTIQTIRKTIESLQNINNIEDEEIEWE